MHDLRDGSDGCQVVVRMTFCRSSHKSFLDGVDKRWLQALGLLGHANILERQFDWKARSEVLFEHQLRLLQCVGQAKGAVGEHF